jgi:hypothetical protein
MMAEPATGELRTTIRDYPKRAAWLEDFAAADDSQQDDHNRDHKQYVDETPHRDRGDEAKRPQDEQDDRNGIEHGVSFG